MVDCKVCDKKQKVGKRLALIIVVILGWVMGVFSIVSGVYSFYNNPFSFFSIVAGLYVIVDYSITFNDEIKKIK